MARDKEEIEFYIHHCNRLIYYLLMVRNPFGGPRPGSNSISNVFSGLNRHTRGSSHHNMRLGWNTEDGGCGNEQYFEKPTQCIVYIKVDSK